MYLDILEDRFMVEEKKAVAEALTGVATAVETVNNALLSRFNAKRAKEMVNTMSEIVNENPYFSLTFKDGNQEVSYNAGDIDKQIKILNEQNRKTILATSRPLKT